MVVLISLAVIVTTVLAIMFQLLAWISLT